MFPYLPAVVDGVFAPSWMENGPIAEVLLAVHLPGWAVA